MLKKRNRGLKVLLSVGGTTYSPHFASPASSDSGRSKFATSVLALIENLGLDGVDIDWEYPANTAQAANMVLLLKEVRQTLLPNNYTVTVACPGPFGYTHLLPAEIDQHVDFWNLMAYDYSGGWSNVTGDQANLFRSADHPESTPFDTESVINYYASHGVSPNRIVLGMPLYGRYFNGTGGLGQSFSGSGTYSLKELSLEGAIVYYDCNAGSSYSYSASQEQLISYDNVDVARQKAAFIMDRLGGAMYWESSDDGVGDESIIQTVSGILRGEGIGLDTTPNRLLYPNSTYANVRHGMRDSVLAPLSSTGPPGISPNIGTILPSSTLLPDLNCNVGRTFFSCLEGICMCTHDADYQPRCVVAEGYCWNHSCSENSDCNSNEICWVDNRCTDGAHCAQVVVGGCVDNPIVTGLILSPVDSGSGGDE